MAEGTSVDCTHEIQQWQGRSLLLCHCFCADCHNGETCVCGECDHNYPTKLDPAYYPSEEKVQADIHRCKQCGTEVFRKGTRGRFPSRCPDCKGM